MNIQFKVNTGSVKTGKHTLSKFNEEDAAKLLGLESDSALLFNTLMTGKIKNKSGGLSDMSIRDKVDYSILKNKTSINSITYTKSVRGCFITYLFEVA